jgi:putative pyruvate formate lyase activating enzyme
VIAVEAGAFRPAYSSLSPDELRSRVERGLHSLRACRACPRDCAVDRLADEIAVCKTGRYAVVSSAFPHFGEEDCLRGWNGSGTIFFGHCNLRCVFCQNHEISQAIKARAEPGHPPEEIAGLMLALQERGCHNINFVTPEHVVPQVLEAVALAASQGSASPSSTTPAPTTRSRAWSCWTASSTSTCPTSSSGARRRAVATCWRRTTRAAARAAIREMHRQVGPLVCDEHGLARRGLLIRHLVMPGALDETEAILRWIAAELGPDTYVNLMDQYHPAGRVSADRYPEIDRRLDDSELREAQRIARDLGLRRLDERRPHPLLALRPRRR